MTDEAREEVRTCAYAWNILYNLLRACKLRSPFARPFRTVSRLSRAFSHLLTPFRAFSQVRTQLASAEIISNDLSHLPPPSAQPKSFHEALRRAKEQSVGYEHAKGQSLGYDHHPHGAEPSLPLSHFTPQLSQELA